jgi:antitoxin MazE
MQVAKWGNSLAVRIPADVARELGLREGDSVDLRRAADGAIEVARDAAWKDAMEAIRRLSRPLPPDYKFDREEANSR